MSVFAVDPALYAAGRASRPLFTALVSNLLFVALLFALLPTERLLAPGIAFVASALVTLALSSWWMRSAIPRIN